MGHCKDFNKTQKVTIDVHLLWTPDLSLNQAPCHAAHLSVTTCFGAGASTAELSSWNVMAPVQYSDDL